MDGGDEGTVGHAPVTAVARSGGGGSGGVPGTRAEWVTVIGQVSGLLLALRKAESTGGASVPVPLSGGRALRAWGYVAPGLRPGSRRVAGSVADLAILGRAARVLGQRLCRAHVSESDDPVVQVLRHEADEHDVAPEHLVAQLARVHGVLSAPSPASAATVWWALDAAPPDPSRLAG